MPSPADHHLPTVLAHAGPHLRVPAGWPLTVEGDRGTTAYVVVAGTIVASRDGRELGRIGPGELAGELALLRGERRNATMVAVTDVEVIALDVRAFDRLRAHCPALRDHLARADQLR
jgi:CRP-like cAMP-binding protein